MIVIHDTDKQMLHPAVTIISCNSSARPRSTLLMRRVHVWSLSFLVLIYRCRLKSVAAAGNQQTTVRREQWIATTVSVGLGMQPMLGKDEKAISEPQPKLAILYVCLIAGRSYVIPVIYDNELYELADMPLHWGGIIDLVYSLLSLWEGSCKSRTEVNCGK